MQSIWMMTQYRKGVRREYRLKKELEKQGFKVIRSAGSHGLWDLVAVRDGEIRLIQVKAKSSAGEGLKEILDFEETSWIISQELCIVEGKDLVRKVKKKTILKREIE